MDKERTAKKHPHANKFAHWLDDRFTIPGTNIKFGLDPVISLIPGAGDWIAGMASSYFLLLGAREDVPPVILARMGLNILLDIIIGSVPLLGDIFDVGWKANTKNARLLEKYQRDAGSTERTSKGVVWGVAVGMLSLVIGLLAAIAWLVTELFKALF